MSCNNHIVQYHPSLGRNFAIKQYDPFIPYTTAVKSKVLVLQEAPVFKGNIYHIGPSIRLEADAIEDAVTFKYCNQVLLKIGKNGVSFAGQSVGMPNIKEATFLNDGNREIYRDDNGFLRSS